MGNPHSVFDIEHGNMHADSDLEKMRFCYISKEKAAAQVDESAKSEDESLQSNQISLDGSDMLTLEGLRRHYNSCSNCGVSWFDDHVSLDCSECGGYAMYRPCPKCEGQCNSTWRRDVSASHQSKKAEWVGSCSFDFHWNSSNVLDSTTLSEDKNSNYESPYHECLHLSQQSQSYMQEAHML